MILHLDTTEKNKLVLSLSGKVNMARIFEVEQGLKSNKLILVLSNFLLENNVSFCDLKRVIVKNYGGGFTSLRVGVSFANALAYALNIPVFGEKNIFKNISGIKVVQPNYD